MNVWNASLLGTVLSISVSLVWATDTDSAMKQAATKIAVEACSTCHRSQRDSTLALVPTLMGQQKSYLAWQLRAYRLHFRDDPQAHDQMWSPAGKIDDPVIDALAEYYASQLPMPGAPGDPALIARGKELYERGIPSQNITDCTYCHGENGEGNGIFPRLAGQRANYLFREISLIQQHLRNIGIMHSTVQGLSRDDIMAVAMFLQSK
jgi:cytochrome c553